MQKVALLAHRSVQEDLLEFLQDEGVLEITPVEQSSGVLPHTEVRYEKAEVQFAITSLSPFANNEQVQKNIPRTIPAIRAAALHTEFRGVIDRCKEILDRRTALEREKTALSTQYAAIQHWLHLPSLDPKRWNTQTTNMLVGSCPSSAFPLLTEELEKMFPAHALIVAGEFSNTMNLGIFLPMKDVQRFQEFGNTYGWSPALTPFFTGTPAEASQSLSLDLDRIHGEQEALETELRHHAKTLPNLHALQIYLRWLDEKQAVRESMGKTEWTVRLEGWLAADRFTEVEQKLQGEFPESALLKVNPRADEDPPVAIRNHPLLTPFESVTKLYSLPLANEMDPTAALAPFFILYFALCLTDGGYGLALILLMGGALLKIRKGIHEAPLIWLLFFAGMMSLLVGIPFGGWFGLTPDQVPPFLTKTATDGSKLFIGQIWNLSAESGIQFLQNLSLVLGIIHIFFGIFLAGWHKWIHGEKAAAFWENFTSHLLLGAVLFRLFAPADLHTIATPLLYAVLAITIWGKGYGSPWFIRPIMGILGLMNMAIGMLSNVLSYLRILALGLATGAMAMAVNQVAVEMGNLFPLWIRIPMMIIIAFGGHLASIALNTLGSFIHSGRLQFIEFFGQFFEGGGRTFSPFQRSSAS